MATHSSVLAWRIPGSGEPGGLPSMGSHRVGHDWSDLAVAASWKKTQKPSTSTLTTWTKWKYNFSVSKDDWSKEALRNWILDIKQPFVSEERAEEPSIPRVLGLDANICRCWLVIDTICKVEAKLDDHFITTWAIKIDWNPYDTKGNTKLSWKLLPFQSQYFFFFPKKAAVEKGQENNEKFFYHSRPC